MILREKTLEEFGYDTNNLTPGSDKMVWLQCPLCYNHFKRRLFSFSRSKNWKCIDCRNLYHPSRKYDVDYTFFEIPNILNSYFAGLLAADGNIAKNRNNIKITLKNTLSELNLLNEFKQNCKYTGKLFHVIRGMYKYVGLSICSKQWVLNLWDNFNIGPAKSLTICPPNLVGDNAIAFIRLAVKPRPSGRGYKADQKHIQKYISKNETFLPT